MENADREQHTSAYELETAPFPSRSSSAHTDIDGYGHDIDPELGLSREQHSERRRGSNEDEIQKSGQSEKVSLPGGNDEQDKDETASCETSRRRLCGSRFLRAVRWTLKLLIDQWVLIGIGIVILLAALFPNVGRRGGAIRSEYTVKYLLVAIIFFISGLSLPLLSLWRGLLNLKLHIVTQAFSFLIFPSFVFGLANAIRAADPSHERFDKWMLVGLVLMGVMPTTVSSNVVMTGQAGGDASAATVEIMIGNLAGTFITPALLQMFLSAPGWQFGKPVPAGGGGTGEIYVAVIKQLAFSVFIPLIIGQIIQNLWPGPTKTWRLRLRLAKIGSLCLIGVIWSTFSSAFYSHSFEALSKEAIITILFLNIGLYVFFTILLFALSRVKVPRISLPPLRLRRRAKASSQAKQDEHASQAASPSPTSGSHTETTGTPVEPEPEVSAPPAFAPAADPDPDSTAHEPNRENREALFTPEVTIAICFCGAAKGIILGGPMAQILYGGLEPRDSGIVSIPLVLYQGSQVVLGQGTVALFKAWLRRRAAKAERGAK